MSYKASVYEIMIASPGDIADEKDIIYEIIRDWNTINARDNNIVLVPLDWETGTFSEMGKAPQKAINEQLVDRCDLLVGVFSTRLGTPTEDAISGTVDEIDKFMAKDKPVMLYFVSGQADLKELDVEQYSNLENFQKGIKEEGLYTTCDNKKEFRKKFQRELRLKFSQVSQSEGELISDTISRDGKTIGDTSGQGKDLSKNESQQKGGNNYQHIDKVPSGEQLGVKADENDDLILTIEPSSFFDNRIAEVFPGMKGLKLIENSEKAVERLGILLRNPLQFKENTSPPSDSNVPIWFWRGRQNNHIRSFKKLTGTKCLINEMELEINRLAVYRHNNRKKSFVYVEAKSEDQTGIYNLSEEGIENLKKQLGYAREEYALLDGTPISKEEYDDGAAEINGKVVNAKGAELRARYLTKYNFFIAPHNSVINSKDFDQTSRDYLDGILDGAWDLEDFLEELL